MLGKYIRVPAADQRAIAKAGSDRRQFFGLLNAVVGKLHEDAARVEKFLTTSAWTGLERQLEQWLGRILKPVLSSELPIPADPGTSAEENEETFSICLDVNASKLGTHDLFQVLPGAAETIEVVIADWIRAQRTVLARLSRDRDQLSNVLLQKQGRRVIGITPGFSDPHERGQTVTALDFAGGETVIYKPRPCDGERIWFSTLAWLNREGFQPSFHIPKLICRENYCWMSFVEHRCCDSKQALREFYFRWGAQAAIAQLLGCTDLHRQNWIASGDHPVLVDAEMVGSTFLPDRRSNRAALLGQQLHPLLRTGLLPLFQTDYAGYYRGMAPFDSTGFTGDDKGFLPVYSGKVERPNKYRDQILKGFEAVLSFLRSRRRKEAFSIFLMRAAQRKHLRVLKRATVNYYCILEDSLKPQHMQKRGQRLQYLLDRCGRDRLGKIEARSLFRCCVPRFTRHIRRSRGRTPVNSERGILDSAKLLAARL